MLVDRFTINKLYLSILANGTLRWPSGAFFPQAGGYESSPQNWKMPRAFFMRYGMTVLREMFTAALPGDHLTAEWHDNSLTLETRRWAALQEGPVLRTKERA